MVVGGLVGYAISYSSFNSKLTSIESELASHTQNNTYNTFPNATYIIGYNSSLSTLYAQVKSSVVVIQDLVPEYSFFGALAGYSEQQGSGFVTSVNNQLVIVTNNHVVLDATNITVTFADGCDLPWNSERL